MSALAAASTMSALNSLRPSLTQTLCKRQLSAYLSPAARSAHSLAPRPAAATRSSLRKPKDDAQATEPPKSPYYGKLKPYDLSKRLRALTEKGEVEAAVTMLKNMPLAAQNVSVWNTVIKAAFEAGKLKLAYSLYTDVRTNAAALKTGVLSPTYR